jgi:NitT/TauT family transport system substrate-binding protein
MWKDALALTAAAYMSLWVSTAVAQGRGETVRIQDYPATGNMLFRVAIAKGYCEKYGIRCHLQMIPTAPLATQALLSKNLDVALLPVEVQVNAMVRGAAIKAFAGGVAENVFLISVRNDVATANSDKGFPAFMADLKGRKIGVTSRGAAPELLMTFLALKAEMKADDFTFVAVGAPITAYASLVSKQIDAMMTFEPAGAMCDLLKTCKTIYRIADATAPAELAATNGGAGNLVAAQDFIDKNPHVIDALTKAAVDAEAFLQNRANFDEAVKIMLQSFTLDTPRGDEIMTHALKRTISGYRVAIGRPAVKAITDYMFATQQLEVPFDAMRIVLPSAP